MHAQTWALAALVAAVALAGCLDGDGAPPASSPSPTPGLPTGPAPTPSPGPQPTASPDPQPNDSATPTPGPAPDPGDNGSEEPAPEWEWPPLDQATIRPGVQMVADGSQCTSNFVFLPPDNSTVYLGFAAHCVGTGTDSTNTDGCDAVNAPLPIGTPVEIEGASRPGRLAYASWSTMQALGGAGSLACSFNDFAVVEIDAADHAKVHPAMLTFGGPTSLAPAGSASMLDKVITFGNTGLRPGPSELDAREGYVLQSQAWSTTIYTVSPGVPGDSGSGVLMADGSALGILVTVGLTPYPASNGVTSLDMALQYARDAGDFDVRLATWELIDPGLLP